MHDLARESTPESPPSEVPISPLVPKLSTLIPSSILKLLRPALRKLDRDIRRRTTSYHPRTSAGFNRWGDGHAVCSAVLAPHGFVPDSIFGFHFIASPTDDYRITVGGGRFSGAGVVVPHRAMRKMRRAAVREHTERARWHREPPIPGLVRQRPQVSTPWYAFLLIASTKDRTVAQLTFLEFSADGPPQVMDRHVVYDSNPAMPMPVVVPGPDVKPPPKDYETELGPLKTGETEKADGADDPA